MQNRVLTMALLALTVLMVAPALAQWGPDTRLTSDTAYSSLPYGASRAVAVSGSAVHVVWTDHRDGVSELYYKRSADYGLTWGADTRLTVTDTGGTDYASVASGGNYVFVVWQDNNGGMPGVYFMRSTNGGVTWSAATRLVGMWMDCSPTVAASVNGAVVHVAWTDNRDLNDEIYYKRSTNYGASWGADTRLTNNAGLSGKASIALASPNLHVAWSDNRNGNYDIYYKRSTDDGLTWGADTRLTVNSSSQYNPSMAAAGAWLYVTWLDMRDATGEVYYKLSTDNGTTWGTDTRLSIPDGFSTGSPSVAAIDSQVYVAWSDGSSPNTDIYCIRSGTYGASWETVARLTDHTSGSYLPNVAVHATRTHVAWLDNRDGNCEVYYKQRYPVPNNVGCALITAPSGTLDSGSAITPACSVSNYGTATVTYNVRMKIGTSYNQTATVTSHAPGARVAVTFPAWTALARGPQTVSCSTELAGDAVPSNDKQTGSVAVRVNDVGCVLVTVPAGTVDSGAVVTPACSVHNYGTAAATYNVRMKVGASYDETATVTSHSPGTRVSVTFPAWTALARGALAVSCSTELTGDAVTTNDKQTGSVTVQVRDASCSHIEAPAGTLDSGVVVTPTCTVYNRGTTTESYLVRMHIGAGYNQTATVSGHAPGTAQRATFPAWTATASGTFAVTCSTELAGDIVPGNDRLSGSVVVRGTTILPDTWTQGAPVPPSGVGKAIKDGGWLVYDASRDRVFAARGNKTGDFLSYVVTSNTWTLMPSWPLGAEAKPPYKGAVGVSDGDGTIYATKGNNEVGFWKFSVEDSTWTQLADVPLGLSNKNVKGGTDLVYVASDSGDFIYLLKGYKTEFYRYDVDANAWETLPDAPAGTKPKYDKGSWLAYVPATLDAGGTIFAHKGKYHELYAYDLSAGTWGALMPGMPLIGQSGKSKKSKDGGAAAVWGSDIYALKGGNTCEFWRYATGSATWTELDAIPEYNSAGQRKRVKAGGDIVHIGSGQFVVTKGNKSDDCWRIRIEGARQAQAKQERSGVMAQRTVRAAGFSLGPNPLVGNVATLRYSLPSAGPATVKVIDVTGRIMLTRSLALSRHGATDLDLRSLSAGVYLVKFASSDVTGTRKLIVQR